MKREVVKTEIIRLTQNLIARNGIRAVRVDEIAQQLGISKRTLYETFTDKSELINACLVEMCRRQEQRIASENADPDIDPLQRLLQLTGEYINNLYKVDRKFLAEIHNKPIFAEHRTFWIEAFTFLLEKSRKSGYLLPEIDSTRFANHIVDMLLILRQELGMSNDLQLFIRTMLRGAATRPGIDIIDRA